MNNELDRTMLIKVIIVEDSRLARLELTELLKAFPEIEIINEADNISKAQRIIETLKPDLIFFQKHFVIREKLCQYTMKYMMR